MSERRIAVDLEGTLASTEIPTIRLSDELTNEHFEHWNKPDIEHLLEMFRLMWEQYRDDIPTTEEDISKRIEELKDFGEVHLVTNTPGDPDDVRSWLDDRKVVFDGYHFPGPQTYKEELDFDVYVDDNPFLWGEVDLLYFYDARWNDQYDGDNTPDGVDPYSINYYDLSQGDSMVLDADKSRRSIVVRVDSLEQVYDDLLHRWIDD